jgi:hypothetical protein
MTDETPESLIPYDEIVQEALRDVVGRVLGEVERSGGLPGDHHFYITFKTRMPGVEIPKHLIERFPEEMTIVIQHRFWDLKVEQNAFSVGLSFGGVPSSLRVPFAAVTDFVDPAVDFSLKFQANGAETVHEVHDQAENDAPVAESDDGSNVVSVDFTRKKLSPRRHPGLGDASQRCLGNSALASRPALLLAAETKGGSPLPRG